MAWHCLHLDGHSKALRSNDLSQQHPSLQTLPRNSLWATLQCKKYRGCVKRKVLLKTQQENLQMGMWNHPARQNYRISLCFCAYIKREHKISKFFFEAFTVAKTILFYSNKSRHSFLFRISSCFYSSKTSKLNLQLKTIFTIKRNRYLWIVRSMMYWLAVRCRL